MGDASEAVETTEQATETETTETTTETVETTQETEQPTSWHDSIADENLRKFAENYSTPSDAVKSALDMRKQLSGAIFKPGKDASEEDLKKFRNQMGVPEEASGYVAEIPEGFPENADVEEVEATIDLLRNAMHEAGATPDVAGAVFDVMFDLVGQAYTHESETQQANVARGTEELKKAWGDDYDQNLEYSKRGYRQFADENFIELMETAKFEGVELNNHPAFTKVFAEIGRRMGEGGLQSVLSAEDRQSTEDRMNDLTAEAHAAADAGDTIKANKLFAERDKLAGEFYG